LTANDKETTVPSILTEINLAKNIKRNKLLHGTRTILVSEIVRDHFLIKAQTSNLIDTSGTR
jgi:hypothetical protein